MFTLYWFAIILDNLLFSNLFLLGIKILYVKWFWYKLENENFKLYIRNKNIKVMTYKIYP